MKGCTNFRKGELKKGSAHMHCNADDSSAVSSVQPMTSVLFPAYVIILER